MHIEWILLAEGVAQDAAGAFTLVGVNQNVLVPASLPATTKRAVVAHVVVGQDEEPQPKKLAFEFRVTAPSGKVLSVASGTAELGAKRYPELPATIDLPGEVLLTVHEFGAHAITVDLTADGRPVGSGEVSLYVLPRTEGGPESFRQ